MMRVSGPFYKPGLPIQLSKKHRFKAACRAAYYAFLDKWKVDTYTPLVECSEEESKFMTMVWQGPAFSISEIKKHEFPQSNQETPSSNSDKV